MFQVLIRHLHEFDNNVETFGFLLFIHNEKAKEYKEIISYSAKNKK